MIHLLILLFPLFYFGRAQQTLYPAAIPLTVRSPYLSWWTSTAKGMNIADEGQTTSGLEVRGLDIWFFCPWHTNIVNSMLVLVRVDNITYSLLGYSSPINVTSNLINTVITPTQTQLTIEAGSMQFKLTFLNPIEVRTQAGIAFIIWHSHFRYSLTIGSSNQSRSHTCH
jgi:hypothetical protein